MRFAALVSLCLTAGLAVVHAQDDASRLIRETEALPPEKEAQLLRVPEGFSVRLYASEPLINKPINIQFDARGRLWVSSTVEYPYAAAKERWSDPQGTRVQDSRDAIRILEDTDGDGTADKVTVFADGLDIPTGVLPWHKPEHKAGCIAWSIPNIWYFADTDGDGVADHREVLLGPFGYERDTHGMCSSFRLGADGWVYATHGFNNLSHVRARDGSSLEMHSGNVFRFRPDGSRVEAWSRGQVNPFGLCWDGRGNLYSADCHSNPLTQLIPGAFYPSFGKPHDGLGFAPVLCRHTHGSTGLCGLVYIHGGIWGPEWDDHMLLGNCVTSRVNHDRIRFKGTTPEAEEQSDFITSGDPWFRPVDMTLGADNALYVADFYNRIIGHYEVRLDHPGRDRERGRIWRIARTGGAQSAVGSASSVHPASNPAPDLLSPDPWTRRAAAQQLAETPDTSRVADLVRALESTAPSDAALVHQLRITLRNHALLPGALTALPTDPPTLKWIASVIHAVPSQAAAEYALARWDSLSAPPEERFPHLARNTPASRLGEVVALARKTAGEELPKQTAMLQTLHKGLLERGEAFPQPFVDWAVQTANAYLNAESGTTPAWTPSPGKEEHRWGIDSRKDSEGKEFSVLSSLDRKGRPSETFTGTLASKPFPAPARLSFRLAGYGAQSAGPAPAAQKANRLELHHQGKVVRTSSPPGSDTLQATTWDLADLEGQPVNLLLIDADPSASRAWIALGDLQPPLLPTDLGRGAAGRALKTLSGLLGASAPVALRDRITAFLPPAQDSTKKAPPAAETEALLKQRALAFAKTRQDPEKGALVFEAQCAVCHRVAGQGALVGPQLDGIGNRGADRLIEDILDPNRNIDTHFRLHDLSMKDGTRLSGMIRGVVNGVVIIADAAGNEQRVLKRDVAKDEELAVSLMPTLFAQTIPESDFVHLLAWLLTK